ncbi:MAG: hypothetical protein GX256_01535 [Fretibacterium sp.]|nr:hypothetical protein [Fretibacterium sp.]
MVLLAHCILNPNAKVAGIAQTPGAIPGIVAGLLRDGVGIIQLPCPEQTFGGSRRWGMSREQYDTPQFRRHCDTLLEGVVDQTEDYLRNGYRVLGIVGVDGSPSCGVERTCAGYTGGEIASMRLFPECFTIEGRGVFLERLMSMLHERGLLIPAVGMNEALQEVLSWDELLKKLSHCDGSAVRT